MRWTGDRSGEMDRQSSPQAVTVAAGHRTVDRSRNPDRDRIQHALQFDENQVQPGPAWPSSQRRNHRQLRTQLRHSTSPIRFRPLYLPRSGGSSTKLSSRTPSVQKQLCLFLCCPEHRHLDVGIGRQLVPQVFLGPGHPAPLALGWGVRDARRLGFGWKHDGDDGDDEAETTSSEVVTKRAWNKVRSLDGEGTWSHIVGRFPARDVGCLRVRGVEANGLKALVLEPEDLFALRRFNRELTFLAEPGLSGPGALGTLRTELTRALRGSENERCWLPLVPSHSLQGRQPAGRTEQTFGGPRPGAARFEQIVPIEPPERVHQLVCFAGRLLV